MSIITEQTTIATTTFEDGRPLAACVGGIDKIALAEAKAKAKQEKREAAAALKAEKAVAKAAKETAKAEKTAEKAAKAALKEQKAKEAAETKAAKEAAKAAKEAVKAEKAALKEQKAKEAAEAKAAKEALKAEKAALKEQKAAATAAKKALKNKTRLTSSTDTQSAEIEAIISQEPTIHETLQHPVTDQQAAEVSTLTISNTFPVHPPPEIHERTQPVPSALTPIATEEHSEMGNIIVHPPPEIGEQTEPVSSTTSEETGAAEETVVAELSPSIFNAELNEDEWEKEIHGEETDAQKIVRLRKEANALIRRARELERTLPVESFSLSISTPASPLREIEGELYSVEEGLIYNRHDELVGFVEGSNDEITWTEGWNSGRGIWDYEAS